MNRFGARGSDTSTGAMVVTMQQNIANLLHQYLSLKTKNAQHSYNTVLRQWCAFLGFPIIEDPPFLASTPEDALAFIAHLKQRKCSDATLRHRFHVLQSVFNFLRDVGLVQINPFAAIKRTISFRQHNQVRPTKLIPARTVKEVLKTPDTTTKRGVRDQAMLALLFGCALRRSELHALTLADVQNGHLELHNTKAGKLQEQSVPGWTKKQMKKLIAQRIAEGARLDDPLFVWYSKSGEARDRISIETIFRLYKRYLGAAPHSARATACTRLKQLGFEDRDVAAFLRHATTRQVEVYDKRSRMEITENLARKISY